MKHLLTVVVTKYKVKGDFNSFLFACPVSNLITMPWEAPLKATVGSSVPAQQACCGPRFHRMPTGMGVTLPLHSG